MRMRQIYETIDRQSYQWVVVLVAGLGFFLDGYTVSQLEPYSMAATSRADRPRLSSLPATSSSRCSAMSTGDMKPPR